MRPFCRAGSLLSAGGRVSGPQNSMRWPSPQLAILAQERDKRERSPLRNRPLSLAIWNRYSAANSKVCPQAIRSQRGYAVPKYLWKGRYSPEGTKGLLKEGGTAREKAVEQLLQSVGGRLEAYYYAFGEHDAYVIVDLPDNATAAAVSLAIAAAGVTRVETIPLLGSEEVDQAVKKPARYRPPGA